MFGLVAGVSAEAAPALAVTVRTSAVSVVAVTGMVVVLNQGAIVPAAEVALLNAGPLLPKIIDELDGPGPAAVPLAEVNTDVG